MNLQAVLMLFISLFFIRVSEFVLSNHFTSQIQYRLVNRGQSIYYNASKYFN